MGGGRDSAAKGALAAVRGRAEEARELAAQGVACADAIHWPHLAAMNRWVIGSLELSLGDPGQAWQALEDIPRTRRGAAWRRSRRSLTRSRRSSGSAASRRPKSSCAGSRKTATAATAGRRRDALRCRALLLLARGRLEAALAAAGKAAAAFERAGFQLDCGRSLLVAGEALRRAGERRRAAEKLERRARSSSVSARRRGSSDARTSYEGRARVRGAIAS